MEEQKDMERLLGLLPHPAFFAQDDTVRLVNDAAARLLLEPGQPVSALLGEAAQDHALLDRGALFLPGVLEGYAATATAVSGGELFVLEADRDQPVLQALALASQTIRQPLADLISRLSLLHPDRKETGMAQLDRDLLRLQRLVCNMSDAARYAQEPVSKLVSMDVCSVVDEIMERAAVLVAQGGWTLEWHCPREPAITLVDREKLERGLHNMLSNALKAAPKGSVLYFSMTRRDRRLYLTLRDRGPGIEEGAMGRLFARYLRQPGLEDPQNGLGLGMSLICAAASVHGGTVLVTRPPEGGTQVTMSMALRRSGGDTIRAQSLPFDYAGEQDHALLELADVLPPESYL